MARLALMALVVAGCGGNDGHKELILPGFNPTPPAAGEMQILSPIIKDVQPGVNVTYCSYLPQKLDHETDVLGFYGSQSRGNHHAVLYWTINPAPVDTHLCTEADMFNVRFIAGIGAEGTASGFKGPPDGLTFRIPAGSQLMIQSHFINATTQPFDGQVAINLRVDKPSAARVVADLITIVNTQFTIPAGARYASQTACPIPHDVTLFMLNGHEHKRGAHFRATQTSAAGQETILYDHDWVPEYESNPPLLLFTKEAPLTFHAGDQIKLTCLWDNTNGGTDISFPNEMCIADGFYFPGHGQIDCVDGAWPLGM